MTPLDAFGLAADADERAVKREYARRLKTTRPDDDPEAFQSLQALYAAALEMVRNPPLADFGFEETEDEGAGEPAPVVETADFARFATQPFVDAPEGETYDADALFDALVAQGRAGDAAGVRTLLANDPELWSLERKAWVRDALLLRLEIETPPMVAEAFDAIVEFFRADASLDPYASWRRLRLRNRMHVAFVLQEAQSRRLAEHVKRPNEAATPGSATLKRRLLLLARTPLQRQLLALVPLVPTNLRGFLLRLDEGQLDDLPPPLEPAAVAFWDKAGDLARISFVRLGVGASRVAALALVAFVVAWFQSDRSGKDAVLDGMAAAFGLGATYAVVLGLVALLCWQSERQRRRKEAEAAAAAGRFPWWWILWLVLIVANMIRALAG